MDNDEKEDEEIYFISVNLYQYHQPLVFNPDEVIQKLQELLPNIEIQPGDALILRLQRAQQFFDPRKEEPSVQSVLRQIERDAIEQGPARIFSFTLDNQKIDGVVKKQYFQFSSKTLFSDNTLDKLKTIIYKISPAGNETIVEID